LSRVDLAQVLDHVAREKGIDRVEVIKALEMAIQRAGRAQYGQDHDIQAEFNHVTGNVDLFVCYEVVEDVENDLTQITPDNAKKYVSAGVAIGETVKDLLPPIPLGRIAAQTARNVIYEIIRDAERNRQYMEYKDKVGEVIGGVVKRVEPRHVIVDIGNNTDGFLLRSNLILMESFRVGERIRSYILDVRSEPKGAQIFLSRTDPRFLAKLFEQEVPEVYSSVIEIKAVSRDPGSRAKVAVFSNDPYIDAVGSCVGVKGSRVQAIVNELQGEKVDIIPWAADKATFVVNALAPAEVSKVIINDAVSTKIEVVVKADHLSLAIGRKGQNVRLASELTGCSIDILTEEQETEKRNQEKRALSYLFMEALDIDEILSHLLIAEGFESIRDIADTEEGEFLNIEGCDQLVGAELKNRAIAYLREENLKVENKFVSLGGQESLRNFEFSIFREYPFLILAENGIFSIDDLADLSNHELIEILPVTESEANDIITRARAHWFDNVG
jgi:transcription termination/antitermination protein NusA